MHLGLYVGLGTTRAIQHDVVVEALWAIGIILGLQLSVEVVNVSGMEKNSLQDSAVGD